MVRTRFVHVIVVAIVAISLPLHAQTGVTLSGTVVDAQGGAVAGATVVAAVGGRERRTTTDIRGEFSLQAPAAGSGRVVVRRAGFAESVTAVVIEGASPSPLRIVLQPAAVEERVVVTSDSPYGTPTATVAGKQAASLRQTPNSVSVLTREQMNDQNIVTTWDALSQMTGVTPISNDSSQSQFHARGAALESQQDGMPSAMPLSGYQQYDMAIYERVEVLRGPAGLLQGSGAFSGTVNLVRRRPTRAFSTSAWASTGQWNNHHVEATVSGPLTSTISGLAVVSGTDRNYYWERGEDRKALGYGVVEWRPRASTTLGLTAVRQRDRTPGFSGLPTYTDGRFLDVDRSFNPYPDWNRYEWDTSDVGLDLEHRLAGTWRLVGKVNRRDQRFLFHDGYPTTGVSLTTGTATYARRESTFDYTSDSADVYAAGTVTLFGRGHDVVAGVNGARFVSQGRGVNPNQDPTLTLTNVVVADPPAVPEPTDLTYRTGSRSRTQQYGGYGMLRSRLTSRITTVLGGRWTSYDNRSKAIAPSTPTDWTQGAQAHAQFTPQAGLVVDVLRQVSLYGSYAEIFAPQTQRRVDGSILDPRIGGQWEVGLKGEHMNGRLRTALAGFQIHDRNRSYPDPVNTGFFVPLGEVRSQGVDAEVTGRLAANWDVSTGYTWLDTKYLVNPTLAGQPISYWYPRHAMKFWSTWRATTTRLAGLVVGLGVQAAGKSASGTDTLNSAGQVTVFARRQDAYAVATVNLSYPVRPGLVLTVQGNNLFDQAYYTRLGGTNTYNSFGDPRNVQVSLRWQLARR